MIVLPLRHELACSADAYWSFVLEQAYNLGLFLRELRFVRYEILEQRDLGETVRRRVRAEPTTIGVPRMLHRYLGYIEEGELDRRRSLYSFRTIGEATPGAVDVHGYMHAQKVSRIKCIRTCEIHIEVKALGLGTWIERRMAEDLTKSYDVSAKFTDWWAALGSGPDR